MRGLKSWPQLLLLCDLEQVDDFPETHHRINRNNLFFLQQIFIEHLLGAQHWHECCRHSEEQSTKEKADTHP